MNGSEPSRLVTSEADVHIASAAIGGFDWRADCLTEHSTHSGAFISELIAAQFGLEPALAEPYYRATSMT